MRFLSLTCLALMTSVVISAAETPANTHCPMSGKPIDPKLGCVAMKLGDGPDAQTVQVGTCTKECADMLVADGKTYRVRVWSTIKDDPKHPHIKGFPPDEVKEACCNITCPVSGKAIDPTKKPMMYRWSENFTQKNPNANKPVLVGFCSDHCMGEFTATPQKFEEALWLQEKNKKVKNKEIK